MLRIGTGALAAVLSLVPASRAAAADTVDAPAAPHGIVFRALSASYVGLSIADWQTTSTALDRGAVERNPALGRIVNNDAAFLATKLAAAGATVFVAAKLHRDRPRLANAILIGANSVMAAIVAHNYALGHR